MTTTKRFLIATPRQRLFLAATIVAMSVLVVVGMPAVTASEGVSESINGNIGRVGIPSSGGDGSNVRRRFLEEETTMAEFVDSNGLKAEEDEEEFDYSVTAPPSTATRESMSSVGNSLMGMPGGGSKRQKSILNSEYTDTLQAANAVDTKKPKSSKSDDKGELLPLCVVDDRGFALSKTDPGFDGGTTIFSSIPKDVAESQLTDVVDAVSGLAGGIAANIGLEATLEGAEAISDAVGTLANALAIGSVALGVFSAFLGLFGGPSVVERKLDIISDQVTQLQRSVNLIFDSLRRDIADQTLDEIGNTIDRMTSAYSDYMQAAAFNETTFVGTEEELFRIQESQRESFRIACNELDFTPYDMIRILSGHACGDPEEYPDRCNVGEGQSTGECEFSNKQRSYFLDKYRLGEGELLSRVQIQEFRVWLTSSLMQALFLQTVCLPSDGYGCPSENDIIREQNLNSSLAAVNETITIFETIEERCICPCKRIVLKGTLNRLQNAQSVTTIKEYGAVGTGDEVTEQLFLSGPIYFGQEEESEVYAGIVTPADSIRIEIQRYATKESKFNRDEMEDGPPIWYRRQCINYPVTLEIGDIEFFFEMEGVSGEECRAVRPDFCSEDLFECGPTQFCDFDRFRCTDKKPEGEMCEDNQECQSGTCRGEPNKVCLPLVSFGGACESSIECATTYCFEGKCCAPNSACDTCEDASTCGSGNCAQCMRQNAPLGDGGGFCLFDCDVELCGPRCTGGLCALGNCFPDEDMGTGRY